MYILRTEVLQPKRLSNTITKVNNYLKIENYDEIVKEGFSKRVNVLNKGI